MTIFNNVISTTFCSTKNDGYDDDDLVVVGVALSINPRDKNKKQKSLRRTTTDTTLRTTFTQQQRRVDVEKEL